MMGGAALKALVVEMTITMNDASKVEGLQTYVEQLHGAVAQIQVTLEAVSQTDNHELALANATLFLDSMGHVVIAWMWLKQAVAGKKGLQTGKSADHDFYQGKLSACNFFYLYELPKALTNLSLVAKLDRTCLDMSDSQFVGA